MRLYFYILIFILLESCAKESLRKDQLILGHAGAGTDYINANQIPNTPRSIEQALLIYELDGVEVDLQFSADIKGFIYHDKTLEEKTVNSGEIYKLNSSALQEVYWKGEGKQTLLTLEGLLEKMSVKYENSVISLDIKNYDPDPNYSAIAEYLNEVLTNFNMKSKTFIESDNTVLLDSIKSKDATISCLLNGRIAKEDYEFVIEKNYDGMVDHHLVAELAYIDSLQAKNKLAVLYGQLTQNDFQSKATIIADVLQVDNPVLAIKSK